MTDIFASKPFGLPGDPTTLPGPSSPAIAGDGLRDDLRDDLLDDLLDENLAHLSRRSLRANQDHLPRSGSLTQTLDAVFSPAEQRQRQQRERERALMRSRLPRLGPLRTPDDIVMAIVNFRFTKAAWLLD